MNLILFETQQDSYTLPLNDPKALHILHVLKMKDGDMVFIGAVNGLIAKARIATTATELTLSPDWSITPSPALPITLIVGLPRPQTARKILQEMTTMGVSKIIFFIPEKGEPNYAQSSLWKTDEWQRHLRLGAEQAFATSIPEIQHTQTLEEALTPCLQESNRIALDVYEATQPIANVTITKSHTLIAIGSERGWSNNERSVLKKHHFLLAHLGNRVLRTESACIVAVSTIQHCHSYGFKLP